MVLSIVLGIVVGIIGFLPLFAGFQLTRKATGTSALGQAGALMLGVLISFLLLLGALMVCVFFMRDVAVPFTFSVIGALLVSAVAFGIERMLWKRTEKG